MGNSPRLACLAEIIKQWLRILNKNGVMGAIAALKWRYRNAQMKRQLLKTPGLHPDAYYDWQKWREAEILKSLPPLRDSANQRSFVFLVLEFPSDLHTLTKTIDSLRIQTYPGWECILIIDEAANLEAQTADLAALMVDSRIKLARGEPGQGLATRLSTGLMMSSAGWVGILQAGDQLTPRALEIYDRALGEDCTWSGIYPDLDYPVDSTGVIRQPLLWPDWSPELLYSVNFMTGGMIRRDLLDSDISTDDATTADLFWSLSLKLVEHAEPVRHVPAICFHAADQFHFRPPSPVVHALKRHGLENVGTEIASGGFPRVTWTVEMKEVSIVILTRDRVEYLRRCIDSILDLTRYPAYQIVIIDTGSKEPETLEYFQKLKSEPRVKILKFLGDFNYSAANNFGARASESELLLFLNNDTQALEADWLEELVRWIENPGVGVVGGLLEYPNGSIQHAGIVIGLEGHANHIFAGMHTNEMTAFGSAGWYRDVSAVTGACLMVRRDVFEQSGCFDEGYQLVFSDVRLCQRVIELGHRVMLTPFARLIHNEGRTRSFYNPRSDLERASWQLRNLVGLGDPYFNPGLSYSVRQPALVRPGESSREERLKEVMRWA
jgi:GT2 family glycosyltransferase